MLVRQRTLAEIRICSYVQNVLLVAGKGYACLSFFLPRHERGFYCLLSWINPTRPANASSATPASQMSLVGLCIMA